MALYRWARRLSAYFNSRPCVRGDMLEEEVNITGKVISILAPA